MILSPQIYLTSFQVDSNLFTNPQQIDVKHCESF